MADLVGKEHLSADALRAWQTRTEADPKRCFLCFRIWMGNRDRGGTLRPIRLAGLTVTREMQVSHILHCMGKAQPRE